MKSKQPTQLSLELTNLSYTYNNQPEPLPVLKNLNATFHPGKLYAIQGESGSGKTTLLSLLSGLDEIQQGDIRYGATSLREIGLQTYRLCYVSIVFQSFNLIKYMTAAENIQVALDFANTPSKICQPFANRTSSRKKSCQLLTNHATTQKNPCQPLTFLRQVGLSAAESSRLVNQLSGGQQQRVAIARALASNCPIIVADEPTGNLDEDNEAKIIKIFQNLAHQHHKIVILVTHSQRVAKQADVVYRLARGNFS